MECPCCSFDNLPGVDQCACCGADLTDPGVLEEKQSEIERDILSRPLGDLAARNYIEVHTDASVRETAGRLIKNRCPCAIVVERDRIVGIFTERDILMRLANQFDALADAPVRDYMTADPVTLRHGDAVVFGLNRMMVGDYRHIPIEKDGKLSGVVSVRDVLRYLAQRLDNPHPAPVAT